MRVMSSPTTSSGIMGVRTAPSRTSWATPREARSAATAVGSETSSSMTPSSRSPARAP